MLKIGDKIPEIKLLNQAGELVHVNEVFRNSPMVLFFYPKDDTPGCTIEACGFRDNYEAFEEADATVIGISSDSVSSHDSFANKHKLPYTLLSDPNEEVRNKFGVSKSLGLFPGRVTFIIDQSSTIQHVINSQLFFKKHISEALKTVQSL